MYNYKIALHVYIFFYLFSFRFNCGFSNIFSCYFVCVRSLQSSNETFACFMHRVISIHYNEHTKNDWAAGVEVDEWLSKGQVYLIKCHMFMLFFQQKQEKNMNFKLDVRMKIRARHVLMKHALCLVISSPFAIIIDLPSKYANTHL